jgi:uncharacterized spore protein YtfJ
MAETEGAFSPKWMIDKLKDFYTVERVFGEPIEVQGKTIVPVAQFSGGGGGGGGEGENQSATAESQRSPADAERPQGTGIGMGFGFGGGAKPVGFLVLDGEKTKWIPTVDAERVALKLISVLMIGIRVAGRTARKKAGGK